MGAKLKLADAFRPKADAHLLYDVNEEAWRRTNDTIFEQHIARVRIVLTEHLRKLYPAQDVQFLATYGCALEIKSVTVRVRVPDADRWDKHFAIELDEPISVANSYNGLYCGGRFSQVEGNGITPKYRAELEAEGRLEQFLANQVDRDQRGVPVELEPFFFALANAQSEYRRDYKRIGDWPKAFKAEHGVYPTWSEIAAEFPLAGRIIRESLQ